MTSYFVQYFASVPTIKALDFFIENQRTSWTIKEIADQAHIAYPSLRMVIPQLLEQRLIFIERDLGKVKLYRLNEENPVVKRLIALEQEVIRQETRLKRKAIALKHDLAT